MKKIYWTGVIFSFGLTFALCLSEVGANPDYAFWMGLVFSLSWAMGSWLTAGFMIGSAFVALLEAVK